MYNLHSCPWRMGNNKQAPGSLTYLSQEIMHRIIYNGISDQEESAFVQVLLVCTLVKGLLKLME